jgi:hypothetical protein
VTSAFEPAPRGAGAPIVALGAGWSLECTGCVPVGGGLIHRSFRVTVPGSTPAGPEEHLLLQELNRHVFTDLDALAANVALVGGVLRTPARVRPTVDGRRWFADDDGRGWRLMTWIDNSTPAPATGSPEVAARLGTAFARFHRDVIDVDPERLHVTIPHFHDPARRGERMVELVLADPHGRRADSQGVGHAAHELTVHQELIQVAASWREPAVPTRVAHLDATPANVLVDEASGEVVAVIDLDTVMPSSWLWDVGDLLRTACTRRPRPRPWLGTTPVFAIGGDPVPLPEFVPAAADALIDAYVAEIGGVLTPAELAALPGAGAVVAQEQAVRFLTDYLEGDVYYPVSFPDENLWRALQQLSLIPPMLEYAERKARA